MKKETTARLTPLAGVGLAVIAAGSLLLFSIFAQQAGRDLYSSPRTASPTTTNQIPLPLTLPSFGEPAPTETTVTSPGPTITIPVTGLPSLTPTLTPIDTTTDTTGVDLRSPSVTGTLEGPIGRIPLPGATPRDNLGPGQDGHGVDLGSGNTKKNGKSDKKEKWTHGEGAYERDQGGPPAHNDDNPGHSGGGSNGNGNSSDTAKGNGNGATGNGKGHSEDHGNGHAYGKSKAKKAKKR